MPADRPMDVVLCWHMHQPEYRDLASGEFQQPWTYLHAIKDYADMAAHLEAVPEARAVVNFAPILLEQIEDYATQLEGHLNHGSELRDSLLAALAGSPPQEQEQRLELMHDCLRANRHHIIDRFKPYQRLARMADWIAEHPDSIAYASDQFLIDLLVWHHLANCCG